MGTVHSGGGRAPNGRWVPVVRPKGHEPLRVVCVAQRYRCFATHYCAGIGTVACLEDACPHCAHGLPLRHDGFLAACYPRTWEPVVVGLTQSACADLLTLAAAEKGLRSLYVVLQRVRNASNGQVAVVEYERLRLANVPPEWDITPQVFRTLGLSCRGRPVEVFPFLDSGEEGGAP